MWGFHSFFLSFLSCIALFLFYRSKFIVIDIVLDKKASCVRKQFSSTRFPVCRFSREQWNSVAAVFYAITFIKYLHWSQHSHALPPCWMWYMSRPSSSHSFHHFMVVVQNSKYAVFISCFYIYSHIYFCCKVSFFNGSGIHLCCWTLGRRGTPVLERFSAQLFVFFCDVLRRRPRHLKVCVQ